MEEKRNPIAIIVTRFGEIKIVLYPKEAPNTVNCFISLAKKGLFDHRKIRKNRTGICNCSRVILTLRMKGVQSHSMENIEITGFRMIFRLSAELSRWAEREM